MKSNIERFMSKVVKTDTCWVWTANSSLGYGKFRLYKKPCGWAHRASYELFKGPIPAGLCVCHSCDNRSCVNPAHLWLGTKGDNIRDCIAKVRFQQGSRHYKAKLTESTVKDMREQYGTGQATVRQLAERLGIHKMTAHCIVKGKTWKHVR